GTQHYSLSLHDALPISAKMLSSAVRKIRMRRFIRRLCLLPSRKDRTIRWFGGLRVWCQSAAPGETMSGCDTTSRWIEVAHRTARSEEHTSELQSRFDLV